MTDETDQPGGRRRGRARIAVAVATLALGLGVLGAAAAGAFAEGGDSSGSDAAGAATTFVQSGETAPQQDAPDRGDCPEGAPQQQGGSEGSSTTPS